MIRSLHKLLGPWRTGVIVAFVAFVIAQTINVAHATDSTLHPDGAAPCQICLAIGHAATPPTPAVLPVPAILFGITAIREDLVAVVLQPTFSSHVPRAPPTFL